MISRVSWVQSSVVCLLFLLGARSVACDEGSYAAQTKKLLLWLPDETESLLVWKGGRYYVIGRAHD